MKAEKASRQSVDIKPTDIPFAYPRLIANVVCMAICGWALLDAHTASAVSMMGGMV